MLCTIIFVIRAAIVIKSDLEGNFPHRTHIHFSTITHKKNEEKYKLLLVELEN